MKKLQGQCQIFRHAVKLLRFHILQYFKINRQLIRVKTAAALILTQLLHGGFVPGGINQVSFEIDIKCRCS